ncbi:hypothetical protein BN59_00831 [Legionella massiliensis]|uniref:Intracellular multiplication protein IcmX n=1 Tax=Legionella massiliensis TaxID=1034943 RepID=A0A078KU93_9GAMM|nr:type IV secretion protein IcmX [Legionella massiliensis]CDZ76557.1 hypothetical protein BN59_00831 [Legionella massiliensis]CEE12295.1 hypothetical protein BN1094_00831 [Legionella massiliensis]
MMKLSVRLVLPGLLLTAASNSFASGPDLSYLQQYLQNLGYYLGINIATNPIPAQGQPQPVPPIPYQGLLGATDSYSASMPETLLNTTFNAVTAFLAANFTMPSVSINSRGNPTPLVNILSSTAPNINGSVNTINQYSGFSFNPTGSNGSYSYYTPNNASSISVSNLIDQQPYQGDPISQGILNILSTPDYTYCQNTVDSNGLATCQGNVPQLTEYQVMANVLGAPQNAIGSAAITSTPLPGTNDYLLSQNNTTLIGQLNVNSLIGPLLYSNTDIQTQQTGQTDNPGLIAQNGNQLANNFIRYVSGLVSPMPLPSASSYDSLVTTANGAFSPTQQQAKATLVGYLTSVRTYAAQMSVGLSNLYYIMSKRIAIPTNPNSAGTNNSPSSEALNEFNMATWRLFNPANPNASGSDSATLWIKQINGASPATVQKEMAVLLAEINYQLYLNRQQEERILLTNTLLLLQNAKAAQPSPILNAPNTTPVTTSNTGS